MASHISHVAVTSIPMPVEIKHAAARRICERAARLARWDDAVPSAARWAHFGEVVIPVALSFRSSPVEVTVGPLGDVVLGLLGISPDTADQVSDLIRRSTEPRLDGLNQFHTWMRCSWDDDTHDGVQGKMMEFRLETVRGAYPVVAYRPVTDEVPAWDDWVGSLH